MVALLASKNKDLEKHEKETTTGRNLMVAAWLIFLPVVMYAVLKYRHRFHGDGTTNPPLVAPSQTTTTDAIPKIDVPK